jgi:hypothetical protein
MRCFAVCLAVFLTCASAANRDLAGRYAGEWKSASSGNGGAIRFTLDGGTAGAWKCDLAFDLDGSNVKTTMRDVKVQDTKVEFTYDFEAQGVTLRSHVMGDWTGTEFKGKYETSLADGSPVDGGTWSAARQN